MASRRLLLFVDGNSTSDGTFNFDGNITVDCIADCIGICTYNVCLPAPLPPSSIPNGGPSANSSIPINLQKRDRLTPTLIITSVSAVAICFALLLILYACLRHRRRARRNNRLLELETTPDVSDDTAEYSSADVHPSQDIEHHIWLIRTQGLDDSTIASIKSWVYKSSEPLIDGRDCSVCLGEFCDGELVRLLPKCSHTFHLTCIDKWLRSNVSCPLCRISVVNSSIAAVPTPSPAGEIISDPSELITESAAPLETTQIEALQLEDVSEVTVIQSIGGLASPSSISEVLPISSEEMNLQRMRRSFSMDTFSLDLLTRQDSAQDELHEEEGNYSTNSEKPRNSLKKILRQKIRSEMVRSLSSRSARWLLSRYGRPRNSVLPL